MSSSTGDNVFDDDANSNKNHDDQEANNIQCKICGTNFTTNERFLTHKGTKKHKRNLKKLCGEVYTKGLEGQAEKNLATLPDASLSQCPTKENEDTASIGSSAYKGMSVREKYNLRNRKDYETNYISYVWSVTAYWAASLVVNPTVKDFKISLNNKKFGDFGDAVIEVEFIDFPEKPSVKTTYAIQFKHIVSNSVKNIDSFSKNSFSIHSVISKIGMLNSPSVDIGSTKFVLFTTAEVGPALDLNVNIPFCDTCFNLDHQCNCLVNERGTKPPIDIHFFAKPLSTRRKNLIDTADDCQSIYTFISTNSQYVLPKVYFYTSQKNPRYFPESIDKIFSEILSQTQVQISREFIKYIENWSKGKAGGCYKLKKEDTLMKLGEIFLSKFRVTPKFKPIEPHSYFNVWVQAINSVDITVLNHPVNLSKICEPFNLEIQKELDLKINITDNTVKLSKTEISNPLLRAYVFETLSNLDHDIPIEKIYLIFWKAGLIPMILQVEDLKNQEYLIQVIYMLKCLGFTRKYFLKTPDVNVKALVKNFKYLSAFVTLDDVAEKLDQSYLNEAKIYVSETFSLSLKTIRETDNFFQKSISATDFFDIALGKYMFRPVLAEEAVEALKLTLNDDEMNTLRDQIESKISGAVERNTPQNGFLHDLDPNIFV